MKLAGKALKKYGNKKIEEFLADMKLDELLGKQEIEKQKTKASTVVLWIFAIIGIIACVAAVAYAVASLVLNSFLKEECDDDDFDYFDDEEDEDGFIGE